MREVFEIMGESITEEEVNTMIKIAGVKSSDKINFKEFVDFFYKIDWEVVTEANNSMQRPIPWLDAFQIITCVQNLSFSFLPI